VPARQPRQSGAGGEVITGLRGCSTVPIIVPSVHTDSAKADQPRPAARYGITEYLLAERTLPGLRDEDRRAAAARGNP
jgi:hypothetical protein